ncbi:atp-dependent clp protease proteolytic subunit 5 [Quercus suber]|uniref:Atp-dependent clp protease proteolytic subunit 5 n=1 Tax=Quercus suber TaxID=58331 RepID=A0AAW0J172_QUESU
MNRKQQKREKWLPAEIDGIATKSSVAENEQRFLLSQRLEHASSICEFEGAARNRWSGWGTSALKHEEKGKWVKKKSCATGFSITKEISAQKTEHSLLPLLMPKVSQLLNKRHDSQENEILHHKANLNRYLAYNTGQNLDKTNQDTDRDFFMSAKEAK